MIIGKLFSANQKRGPDVGPKTNFLISEENLTKMTRFHGCIMNIDQITRIIDGDEADEYSAIVYFTDGKSQRFTGVSSESLLECLAAFGGGKEIPPFGGERTLIPKDELSPSYEF